MLKSRWVLTCTTVMVALAASTAIAKQTTEAQHDQGRGRVTAHMKFDDNDRQATRTWYDGHQHNLPVGLRDTDRMAPATESQFREGYVLDRAARRNVHSVPSTLLRLLAPAPRNYRYVAVEGYVVLIDSRYKVVDVMLVRHDR